MGYGRDMIRAPGIRKEETNGSRPASTWKWNAKSTENKLDHISRLANSRTGEKMHVDHGQLLYTVFGRRKNPLSIARCKKTHTRTKKEVLIAPAWSNTWSRYD